MYIISTGLLDSNQCQLNDNLFVYTDLRITEDYHSLYLTFVNKTNEGITGFSLENCEFDSSISDETIDGEYVTRMEILLGEHSKYTYKDYIWVSSLKDGTRYVTMPNGKTLSYNEEYGFLDNVDYHE